MQVIVVNDTAHVDGGAAQVALAGAGELARRGHAVTVLAAVGPVAMPGAHPSVKVHCLEQRPIATDPRRARAALQGLWNVRARQVMARLVSACDPRRTIVHLHGWSKALSTSVIAPAIERGIKVVCTLHDYAVACPTGGFFDHRENDICTRRPLSAACIAASCDPRSYSHKAWRVLRQAVQQGPGRVPAGIDAFFCVSAFSRERLQPHLPAGVPIFLLTNPICAEEAPPARPDRNDAFVVVARLSAEKGIDLAARAARRAAVPLRVVGDGPEAERLRRSYPEVEWLGWRAGDEVARVMRSGRALVFPSLWYETQGLVVLEAAARGIPSIVSDGCAARDLVTHEGTGLHVRRGDEAALSRAMTTLHSAPALAAELGQRAYHRFWSDPPTLARHGEELEALLRARLRS